MSKSTAIDISGQTFGHLTVIERAGTDAVQRSATWLCRCDCGNETIARGVALRKGNRRSCGCRNPHLNKVAGLTRESAKATIDDEVSRWHVEETDGTVFLLGRFGHESVLVEWDEKAARWNCSACGPHVATGVTSLACAHIVKAAGSLPLDVALRLASQVAQQSASRRGVIGKGKSKAKGEKAAQKAEVAVGAERRARRLEQRDAEHLGITSEVRVRPITDVDRRRLAERRRRKTIGE